jgi:hypothetical protein
VLLPQYEKNFRALCNLLPLSSVTRSLPTFQLPSVCVPYPIYKHCSHGCRYVTTRQLFVCARLPHTEYTCKCRGKSRQITDFLLKIQIKRFHVSRHKCKLRNISFVLFLGQKCFLTVSSVTICTVIFPDTKPCPPFTWFYYGLTHRLLRNR